ncbi:hypothetical protein COO60DRAFT_1697460 [Scenedesmus sp. NREL 46B-D3]|nr:hypothetical protein COO60DRAFT_1697460 [Scenedesmus sp. NREL 46B-D3]
MRLAEAKLFSSNSSNSDLQDSINMLLDVADALQRQLRPTTVQQQQQGPGTVKSSRVGSAAEQEEAAAAGTSTSSSGGDGRDQSSSSSSSSGVSRGSSKGGRSVGSEKQQQMYGLQEPQLTAAAAAAEVLAGVCSSLQPVLRQLQRKYTLGRGGVSASCTRSLAWLAPAARSLAAQAEQEGTIDPAPGGIFLRERWQDAASPSSAATDERQLSLELEADAAIHADSYSLRRLGYRRLLGRGMPADPATAFQDFIAAADGGDGYAWHNLGVMLLQGSHVPRDPSKALTYFQRALDRGVAASANALGVMHAVGAGMPASMAAARGWFEQGANMSSSEAYFNLGTIYLHGLGVEKDTAAAFFSFSKALTLGHWKAALPIAELHMKAAGKNGPARNSHCELASSHFWQFVSQRASVWSDLMNAALRDYYATGTYLASPLPQEQPASAGDAAAAGGAAAQGWHVRWQWAQRHRLRQALLRFLLMAESGSEVGSANAAWMLTRGEGAGGGDAVDLAAELLLRAAMLNHTSSMVQLGQVLVESAEVLLSSTQQGGTAAAASATELMLHHKLQEFPNAFLPPVGGDTNATGRQRPPLPTLLDTGAWRAKVGWLHEAASLGDVEAAAQLAWLWQRGEVLPTDRGKAERLMDRALQHAQLTASHAALLLVRLCMWLELASQQLLGRQLAASLTKALAAARDVLVKHTGVADVIAMPEGLTAPPEGVLVLEASDAGDGGWTVSSSSSSSLDWASEWLAGDAGSVAATAATAGDASAAHGGAGAATRKGRAPARGSRGAAAVDADASGSGSAGSSSGRPGGVGGSAAAAEAAGQMATADNIVLTILLGALAVVLLRRQRRGVVA